jgi:uncharacterized integral membrane protein
MSKKNNNIKRERKIGKQAIEKKPAIDPKLKSTIWTIITLVILLVFFIINNTRTEPEEGPYPPNYAPKKVNTQK